MRIVHAKSQRQETFAALRLCVSQAGLSLPILPINQTTLAAPLIGTFDAQRLAELQQQVLVAIKRSRARTLVLDITGILRVAQAARLLGARVVLAGGFRPEVAQAIVGLEWIWLA